MKFYQGLLPRIIWDPSKNKALLEFSENGEFETEDENLIKLLRGKGYPLEADLLELERTGRLPHGGFEKVIEDGDLPSGRSAIEDESTVHGPQAKVRPRQVPVSEEADIKASTKTKEPVINIGEDEEKPKTRKKTSKKSTSKRTIKRRKK